MNRWSVLSGLLVSLACGGTPETTAELEVVPADGGAGGAEPVEVRATWTYRSFEVDVDATLATAHSDGGCVTTGRLAIDEALATAEVYYLSETECPVLHLTETGDIVLHESPTGHDWSTEHLQVDTEREAIELGPWSPDVPEPPSYRFTLDAPPCGGGCSCPAIRRRGGGAELVLELGRDCD